MLVVQGVGTGLVGTYGSSTAVTPALDHMAARGIVLDQCFVDSQSLPEQLASLWTGRHALQSADRSWSLWSAAAAAAADHAARRARLLTDSREVADIAAAWGCEAVTLIEVPPPGQPASEPSACAMNALFAAAVEEVLTGPQGLVWIHSRGLQHAWDAPLELRGRFADPDDPPPPAEVELPSLDVGADVDPDWLVGWGQVAAAQTAVLDEAVHALWDAVQSREDREQWSCLFTSLGGVPLGEHGRLGWGRPQLYAEELQTATLLYPAGGLPVGIRRPELFQLPDLAAAIAHMLGWQLPAGCWGRNPLAYGHPESPQRWPKELSLAMIASQHQGWIRSPAWSALLASEFHTGGFHASEEAQLFVKPEDRWEISQIAQRRRDVVERHCELAEQFIQACRQNDRQLLPVLEDELTNLMR